MMPIGFASMPTHFEYLDFINARDQINHRYDIDIKSCVLLRVIVQAFANDQQITVTDVIALRHLASPVTLHQGIKHLLSKKLIATKSDPKDGRIKYLVPASKALKLYRELSALVVLRQSEVAT
jgi:DNA-binding MarR family transcriptional regulator